MLSLEGVLRRVSLSASSTTQRTILCGELRAEHAGLHARLGGWVHRTRNLGGLVFIDLRDRAGLVQVSMNPDYTPADVIHAAASLPLESVVLIEGVVVLRPEGRCATRRWGLATSRSGRRRSDSSRKLQHRHRPFPVAATKGGNLPAEELRLRYRYLDLSAGRSCKKEVSYCDTACPQQTTRRYLDERGFLEIETPILTKPTPEGARDYLVPSRVHQGEFYALPQSPQLYKQLLMISGFDRYFQIARCFRDEDLRADRQPEFTQIDIEASFVQREDIYTLAEGLMVALFADIGRTVHAPFQRILYTEAMERYGSDRPDLRFRLEIHDVTRAFEHVDFAITRTAIATGGRVRAIRIPNGATLSRKQVDEIEAAAKSMGAAGLLRLKCVDGVLEGPLAKVVDAAARGAVADRRWGSDVDGRRSRPRVQPGTG